MSILIFFIILLILVLVHELGHFVAAKMFGIRVDEFGFGFPPKLFGIKRGETEYSFNLLPIGGFVKIFGETPNAENTFGPDSARSMVNKSTWKQATVLFAGVFMNFILAWVLFSYGFMSGLPTAVGSEPVGSKLEDVHLVVVTVDKDSPALGAGLGSGDKILSVHSGSDSLAIINPESLRSFISAHAKNEIEIGYTRGKSEVVNLIKVTPTVVDGTPRIGIAMDQIGTAKLPFLSAIREGMSLTLYTTKNTAVGLYSLIKEAIMGRGSFDGVAGPVGIVSITGEAYKFGFSYLLSFMALISINLAIINLIPFPALDGGRLFFLLIEKIKGSAMNPRVINSINTVGFALLILLMVVITYHDIVKLL
jgi:regulator of sigma E protease